jgi:hypothetical protein
MNAKAQIETLSYPIRWAKARRFMELTGETKGSIDSKIHSGSWTEGEIWVLAADNQRRFNLPEYDLWVENSRQASRRKSVQSKSGSFGESIPGQNVAESGKASSSPPPKLILRERQKSATKSRARLTTA